MNLAANALTTLDQTKSHLGIDLTDTSQDDLLIFFINAASEYVEKACGRKFGKTVYDVKIDGTGTQSIFVSNLPIISIASVTQDCSAVASDQYVIYNESGKIFKDRGWTFGNQNIEINYTAGFVLPKDEDTQANPPVVRTLPFDLELVCIKLAGAAFNKKDAEGIKNASAGNLNVNFNDGIDKGSESILNTYSVYHV